jgi:hypothetical protein
MTAQIVELQTDQFRPYRRHGEDDKVVIADARMLKEIELWASSSRQATEHDFKPLAAGVRKKALEVLAILKDQPR